MFLQGFLMMLDLNEVHKLEFIFLSATGRVYQKQAELSL